jgi:hypothetical protein
MLAALVMCTLASSALAGALPGWHKGAVGQSCTTVCTAQSLPCFADSQRSIDTKAEYKTVHAAVTDQDAADALTKLKFCSATNPFNPAFDPTNPNKGMQYNGARAPAMLCRRATLCASAAAVRLDAHHEQPMATLKSSNMHALSLFVDEEANTNVTQAFKVLTMCWQFYSQSRSLFP